MRSGQGSSVPLVRPEPNSAWGTISDKRWLEPNHHSLSQVTSCRRWGLAWSYVVWLELSVSSHNDSMKSLSWQKFPYFYLLRGGSRLRETRIPHNCRGREQKHFPWCREGPSMMGYWHPNIKQNGRCAHHERETEVMTISTHLCLQDWQLLGVEDSCQSAKCFTFPSRRHAKARYSSSGL